MSATLTLKGGKQLHRQLDRMPKGVRNKILRQATRKAAKLIEAEAERLAPVDEGEFRKAHKTRAMKRTRREVVGARVVVDKTDAFHLSFVELGTENMEGRHTMRQAAENKAQAAVDKVVAAVRQKIVEVAKRA